MAKARSTSSLSAGTGGSVLGVQTAVGSCLLLLILKKKMVQDGLPARTTSASARSCVWWWMLFFFFMLRVGTDVSFPAVPLLSKALEKVRQDAVCGPGSCVAWNRTFCSLPSPYCFCVIKSSWKHLDRTPWALPVRQHPDCQSKASSIKRSCFGCGSERFGMQQVFSWICTFT